MNPESSAVAGAVNDVQRFRPNRRTFFRSAGALAGAGLGALLLDGCGSDSTASTGGKVTLQFMRPGSQETIKKIYQPMLDAFVAANPSVTIDPIYMGFDECYQRMPLLAATGKLPDVFLAPGQLFPVLADKGAALAVESKMGSAFGDIKADVPSSAWQAVTYNGEILGVPAVLGPLGLWYNQDLFAQAGLDPEKAPETWDDFVTALKALKSKTSVYPLALNAFPRNDATDQFAAIYASRSGKSWWDSDKKRMRTDDPELLKTIEFMRSLVDQGLTEPNVGAISNDDVRTLFRDGKAAMMFSSCSGSVAALKDVKFKYKSALMPRGGSVTKTATAMSLDSWGISAATKNPDMAIKLLVAMTSAENEASAADNYGTIPPSNKVLSSNPTYKSGIWPPFVEALGSAFLAKPVQPNMALVSTELPMMLQEALTNSTPQDALEKFVKAEGW